MSALGLGRAKTPAVAPHVEIFPSNCISESQIILHTRGSMPYWRIVFSTFLGCMSFYTAWSFQNVLPEDGLNHARRRNRAIFLTLIMLGLQPSAAGCP